MNAKRLFEDDDLLFGDPSDDRASHVEIKVERGEEGPPTEPELEVAANGLLLVPYLLLSEGALTLLSLDHREGFLLSRVDGQSTIETLLDVCAMPADEAIEILERLVDRGIVGLA